jgi:hypothetical protein
MSSKFVGSIIKESLEKKDVLAKLKITAIRVEKVTAKHKTPWLKEWTIYSVEVSPEKAAKVANELGRDLESAHNWYADFKNDDYHFIVFRNKVFRIDIKITKEYDMAKKYGIAQGIPEYQIDFHPDTKRWKR